MLEKPKLGIDIDGVLVYMLKRLRDEIDKRHGVYFELSEVTRFGLEKLFGLERKKVVEVITDWDFLRGLPEVPFSKEALDILHNDYELHLVTARGNGVLEPTVEWLVEHDYRYDHIAVGWDNKSEYVRKHNLFWFIEDRYRNAVDISKYCEKVFLVNRTYNSGREVPENVIRVNTWHDLLGYFYADE